MDEPELGLNPFCITLLASLVKQAATHVQVILATQSSLLRADHLDPEDVLVADRVNGATNLTRLDTGSLQDWLEEYSLGQLWEKNVSRWPSRVRGMTQVSRPGTSRRDPCQPGSGA